MYLSKTGVLLSVYCQFASLIRRGERNPLKERQDGSIYAYTGLLYAWGYPSRHVYAADRRELLTYLLTYAYTGLTSYVRRRVMLWELCRTLQMPSSVSPPGTPACPCAGRIIGLEAKSVLFESYKICVQM